MSTLERIVPPLDLCKKIPEGEFEDSALVWDIHGKFDKWHVEKRVNRSVRFGDYGRMSPSHADIPAPTMDEILEGIGGIETWDTMTIARITNGKQSLTTNTLKRWFKVKGIEVEK